jgi:hypothetical protein
MIGNGVIIRIAGVAPGKTIMNPNRTESFDITNNAESIIQLPVDRRVLDNPSFSDTPDSGGYQRRGHLACREKCRFFAGKRCGNGDVLVSCCCSSFPSPPLRHLSTSQAKSWNGSVAFQPDHFQPPSLLENIPGVGPWLADKWRHAASASSQEISARLVPYSKKIVAWFISQAGNVGVMILHFLLTVIIAAVLYANGETASRGQYSGPETCGREW